MKKILLISVMLVFGMVTSVWALSFSGNIASSTNGGMLATDGWSDGNYDPDTYSADALLKWTVESQTQMDGSLLWTYDYTFIVDEKGISHVINEVTADDPAFTLGNIYAGTTSGWAINTYTEGEGPGKSNPGIPAPVYGIKWDTPEPDDMGDVLMFEWIIVTDRAPMWGDFYAKDGTFDSGTQDVYAYNSMFGVDTSAEIASGNAGGWVLVPDSDGGAPIPEPSTILLVGTGLLGIIGFGRKRLNKKA